MQSPAGKSRRVLKLCSMHKNFTILQQTQQAECNVLEQMKEVWFSHDGEIRMEAINTIWDEGATDLLA